MAAFEEAFVVPSGYRAGMSDGEIIALLPDVVRELLTASGNDKKWQVVKYRFGFGNVQRDTLEAIGNSLGVSRQRVQQLEAKAIELARNALVDERVGTQRRRVQRIIHPAIVDVTKKIWRVLTEECGEIETEAHIRKVVSQHLGWEVKAADAVLEFFVVMSGFAQVSLKSRLLQDVWADEPLWTRRTELEYKQIEKRLGAIFELLTEESSLPRSHHKIVTCVNRKVEQGERLTLFDVPMWIALCPFVEILPGERVQAVFQALRGRANQAERLLTEAGKPMSIEWLVREIDSKMIGDPPIEHNNLRNQLIRDTQGRFEPVGRSGDWALVSQNAEVRTILDLMKECFRVRNTSLTVEEVYSFVRGKREGVERNSIVMYLDGRDDFKQVTPNKWALSKWRPDPNEKAWGPEEVAEFVAQVFRSARKREMDYTTLKCKLAAAMGVSEQQAQGRLNQNPIIKTQVLPGGVRLAIFQPNYSSTQSKPRIRKVATLRQQIQVAARQIIMAHPEQELQLDCLRQTLHDRFPKCPRPTIYRYLADMMDLEKVDIPGEQTKLCRLRTMEAATQFAPN